MMSIRNFVRTGGKLKKNIARRQCVFATLTAGGKGAAPSWNSNNILGSNSNGTSFLSRKNGTLAAQEQAPDVAKATPVISMQDSWHQNLTGEEWLNGPRTLDWFTGKVPVAGVCPGVDKDGVLRSLPVPNLNQVTRKATQEYFDNTWTLLETMFGGLNGEETFYRPPVHGLRHPQIFYYGHSACLYVNKLRVAGVLDKPVDSYLESILETGVDEMLWDDMHKFDDPWPTVKQVHEYRQKVYALISEVIAEHPGLEDNGGKSPVKITMDNPLWALFMGFEHERIHLETSSVLFREMPQHLLQVPTAWPAVFPPAENQTRDPKAGVDYPLNEMLPVEAAPVTLGKPKDFPAYGWDNEYGNKEVEVSSFTASKYLITNGEFYEFVKEGGYGHERFWCVSGWKWRKFRNMKWPFFWDKDGPAGSHLYKLRTVFETVPMHWALPVNVNYYEARAYCRWKAEKDGLADSPLAYRVITEAEHHLIRPNGANNKVALQDPMADRPMTAGGDTYATRGMDGNANLNLAYGSESPVDLMEASPTGHYDAMGNVWEWTEDDFDGLEGFQVHPIYTDFSAPCFDGQHTMIMGGSFVSTGIEASTFARYAFRPHFLQHAGFRMVSSATPAPAAVVEQEEITGQYESNELVHQYLGLHYALQSGKPEGVDAILPHDNAPTHALRFPQRLANLITSLKPQHTTGRALDVGCAVGGTSFELATTFDKVYAIDFSHAFIDTAKRMQQGEEVSFGLVTEGELAEELVARHEAHIELATRERVVFQRGDATDLTVDALGGERFDAIVVANLICRVPEPLKCLDGLAQCTNPGGVVLLVTPFSWLEEHTPKDKWLGGFTCPETGESVSSKDRLQVEMEARGFTKIHEEQVPLLIREHQRKYQYIVSEATGWRRME